MKTSTSSWPPPVTRDALGDLFLRVTAQLDALQPPLNAAFHTPEESTVETTQLLLPSRERIDEILRSNARFRPAEETQRRRATTDSTSLAASPASLATTRRRDAKDARRHPTEAHSPRRDSNASAAPTSCHEVSATSASSPPPSAAPTTATAPPPVAVFVPVGGRARVFPSQDLARARRSMKKRSLALTNLQSLAPSEAAPVAGSSAWDLRQASSQSASAMSGKQALISELVRRTNFSTQHIFHMSRKFKEIAGPARSVISFAEFRALLSEDVGALLLAIGVDADDAAFQELARTDLRAISATISASESFLRRLFATFDGDGDGKIDFREFVVGLNGFVKGSLEDKVDALFDAYQPTTKSAEPQPHDGSRRRSSVFDRSPERKPGGHPNDNADLATPRETTVAISDLLGLFQGDRQLYQELMRCVDEYFARIELRDSDDEQHRAIAEEEEEEDDDGDREREGGDTLPASDAPRAARSMTLATVAVTVMGVAEEATTLSRDDFVAASLAEPRLLETITRPTPSLVFSEDAVLRERLKAFVDRRALGWGAMVELQRRVLSSVRSATSTSSSVTGATSVSPADLKLPSARVLQLLTELSTTTVTSPNPSDDSDRDDLNVLLRAYLAKPSSSSGASRATTPSTAAVASSSSSSPLVDVAALLQDLAVVLLHPTAATTVTQQDTEAKARYYFERFDLNGDGMLSRHELVSAVCAGFAHFGPSLTEVVRVLEDEDADQDGELTKTEYLRAARRSPLILASLYTCL